MLRAASSRIPCHAVMDRPVEHHVLVDLVGQDDDVGVARQRREARDVVIANDGGGGIVGRVEDDHPRFRRDGRSDLVPIDAEQVGLQFDCDRCRPLQAHHRSVAVEGRLEVDDLVTRVHERTGGGIKRLAGADHDRDFAVGIVAGPIHALDLVGDGVP